MTVIAMTREMGTLGKEVAAQVAEELDVKVVHHELVERHVAERMDISEHTVHRFLEGEASMWDRWNIDARQISAYTSEEILNLALGGDVLIRGWGAAQLLADVGHVLCVRVCAPMDFRVAEMRQRLRIDDDDQEYPRGADRGDDWHIRQEIEHSDEAHDRAVRSTLRRDWRDPLGYHLVLNTGITPIPAATEAVLTLARAPEFQETPATRARLTDKLTLSRVRSMLRDSAVLPRHGGGIELSISEGIVTARGLLTQDIKVDAVLDAIGQVEGVREVRNAVQQVAFAYGP